MWSVKFMVLSSPPLTIEYDVPGGPTEFEQVYVYAMRGWDYLSRQKEHSVCIVGIVYKPEGDLREVPRPPEEARPAPPWGN